MKKRLLPLSLILLGATVASAHVHTPLPENRPENRLEQPALAARPVTATPGPKYALDLKQAPVPLLIRERPAAWVPPKTRDDSAVAMTAADAGDGTGDALWAKSAIQADGYKSVSHVTRGPGGTWRARAMRGASVVGVTVDREGRVTAD